MEIWLLMPLLFAVGYLFGRWHNQRWRFDRVAAAKRVFTQPVTRGVSVDLPETLLDASNAATHAVGSIMGVMPNQVVDVPLAAAQG